MKTHISLYVSNLEQSKNFYEAFFGVEPVKVKDKYMKFDLEDAGLIISFIENKDRVQSGLGHFGFVVDSTDEVLNRMEKAKSKHLDVLEEFGTNCCYANQDKFWVKDPDGFQWEVYSFNSDVEFNDPNYSEGNASACCMPEPQKIELP